MGKITRKFGFFTHHTNDCNFEFKNEASKKYPYKSYWCHTHGQWCDEFPIKTTITFADGSTTSWGN